MEEIKVYHSLWKNGILIAVCFAFAAISIYTLVFHPEKDGIWIWLGILFFGLGGLFMLWLVLRERITNNPYYVITDKSIIMNTGMKTWEVRFDDVEHFFLTNAATAKMIGIRYKKDVEFLKMEDASKVGRAVRRFNESIAGSQEGLPAANLTMPPKVLCEILNERLEQSQKIR